MAASQLTDFSDRLSPMLVKELRQGLRTNLFTTAFILLQVFMVFTVFIGAAAEGDTGAVSGFFWFFLIATLLVAMPIRGFGALSTELQLNTMDLIQLTRLSAWRITFGKWAALMSQTSLLVISVTPYLVMRYFFGGIDLIQEFLMLFFAFFGSALLTALSVGFSAFRSVLLRGFILVSTGFTSLSFAMSLSFSGVSGGRGFFSSAVGITSSVFWWNIATTALAGLYAIYFLLDLGASQIAPQAENHSTRKRLITLIFVIAILSMTLVGVDEDMVVIIATLAIILTWIDAITERPSLLPSVINPFSKNVFFSLSKYLLSPGWHTGILFVIVSGCLFLGLSAVTASPVSSWTTIKIAEFISWGGAVTYPLIFIHLFIPNSKQMFGLYILIQCCTLVISVLIGIVSSSISSLSGILFLCFPIPAVSLMALNQSAGKDHPVYFLLASALFTLLSIAIPFWRALPLYRKMLAGSKPLPAKTQFKVDRLLR